ncbi:hypothetical protein [Stakelama marina]|uniref:Uncharacterized protein n=1 Tax=Stakelama marina TaxID=2826939 RepID=A0A8T4ID01_9SPHN|nr:hypothetical protein [Stakelama marina]MBR0551734.1 hypothetical protein [Stakelama marina]
MHRISRADLHDRLYVTVKSIPKHLLAALRGKLPVASDQAAAAIANLLCDEVDGPDRMVIEAESVSDGTCERRPGRFGVTEPDPISYADG